MRSTLFFITFLLSIQTYGQERFFDRQFSVKKRSYTYQRVGKNLRLDFYTPKKVKEKLPLIVFVHGGAFSGGKRNDKGVIIFAKKLAERGYAVASISYRLTMKGKGFGCNIAATEKIKAFDAASEDISYAVKYLLGRPKKFAIQADKIILIGSSAGAEAVLNLVYVNNTTILPKEFRFGGVVGFAGAIRTLDSISPKKAIPTQLFHGTKDEFVPYEVAPHHYCTPKSKGYLTLYGSKAIANQLKNIDKGFYLYTIEDGNHSWAGKPMYACLDELLDFLYHDVVQGKERKITTSR